MTIRTMIRLRGCCSTSTPLHRNKPFTGRSAQRNWSSSFARSVRKTAQFSVIPMACSATRSCLRTSLACAVIPVMRAQRSGRIVNLSSVAGAIPIPFQAFYSASKAAINSYTMALANEIKPFGVQVCCVQPGDIQTGFTAARQKIVVGDDIYGGRISRSVAGMEKDERTGMRPEDAGAFVCRAATRKGVRPVNTIGLSYKFFCVLQKLLPAKTLNWLVGMVYAR